MTVRLYNFPAAEYETARAVLSDGGFQCLPVHVLDLYEPLKEDEDALFPVLAWSDMPESEGQETHKLVSGKYPFTPIWMVSPSYRPEDVRAAYDAAFTKYVLWSPDLEDFRRSLRMLKSNAAGEEAKSGLTAQLVSLPLEQQLVTDRILSSITDASGNLASHYYPLVFNQRDLQGSVFHICVIRMTLPLHIYLRPDSDSACSILINQVKLHMETVEHLAAPPFLIRKIIKTDQLICLFYRKPAEKDGFEEEIVEYVRQVNERVRFYLGISLVAGYSRPYRHIAETPLHYRRIISNLEQGYVPCQAVGMLDEEREYLSFSKEIDDYIKKNLRLAISGQNCELIIETLIAASRKFMEQNVRSAIAKTILLQALIKFSQETDFYLLINPDFLERRLYTATRSIVSFAHLQEMFALIGKIYAKARGSYERGDENRLALAMQYIQKNYCHKISLTSVSKYLALTPNYFCGWFKRQTGENFNELVIRYRVDAAKSMLAHSTKKICDIAAEVGYEEIVSFNRTFKKSVGMSPDQYRKTAGSA